MQITKNLIKKLHYDLELTTVQMAKHIDCNEGTVRNYMKKYGLKKLPKYARIKGQRFGNLIVKKFVGILVNKQAYWLCQCDCGNTIIVQTAKLRNGAIKSCGCLVYDVNVTHGMSQTRQYRIWQAMKSRCDNSNVLNYYNYGGRGISYVSKWVNFKGFWENMKEGYKDDLTLERKDNSKGYSKENCIWTTIKQQNFNKTNSVLLSYKGKMQIATQWAKELNVSRNMLYLFKKNGFSDNEIFERMLV